jgi:hypothetical protein
MNCSFISKIHDLRHDVLDVGQVQKHHVVGFCRILTMVY